MFRGMGSDFVLIEGEENIKSWRTKTRLSEEKIKIWDVKEKKKGQDER